MPCFTNTSPHLEQIGPVIETVILPSSAFRRSLTTEQEKDQNGQRVVMLVDTGASHSAIDKEVALALGLKPHGVINIATPSSTSHPVEEYDVDITLVGNKLHVRDVRVFASAFGNQGIGGLLGRDVLKNMLLIYQGYSNQFTLAV